MRRAPCEPVLGWLLLALAVWLCLPELALSQDGDSSGGPPTMPLPTEAGGDTQALLSLAWGWMRLALEIVIISIGVAIFALVAWFVVGKFIEIGRTQGTFAMAIPALFVGLFVLAVAGVLLTIGWNILQNTTLTA